MYIHKLREKIFGRAGTLKMGPSIVSNSYNIINQVC